MYFFRSRSQVVAQTPAFDDPLDVPASDADRKAGAELPIMLFYGNEGLRLVAKETFRYLPDPVITDFYPKDTIVQ